MPPKRKRAETNDAAEASASTTSPTATRATRSSTRNTATNTAAKAGTSKSAATIASAADPVNDTHEGLAPINEEDAPVPKKGRSAASKTTNAKSKTAKTASKTPVTVASAGPSSKPPRATKSNTKSNKLDDQAHAGEGIGSTHVKTAKHTLETKPYSPSDALALFSTYADSDDPDVIDPEGLEQLCSHANIPMDGALPLILAWQLETKEMMKIRRDEWVRGTDALKISSLATLSFSLYDLNDLLILNKPALPRPELKAAPSAKRKSTVPVTGAEGPYNRERYWEYANDVKKAFGELYLFCLGLGKSEGSRNVDMEMAVAFWSVLVVPRYPIMSDIIDFVNEKGTYKGVNKDLWIMTLEFCQTVGPDLENYESDGAWPTMLDDFVSWKKLKEDGGSNACTS